MSTKMVLGEREIPARWEICGSCEGKSSAYLGAYTRKEFDEAFSYEEQQDYFEGKYDCPCERCKGRSSVLEPDRDLMTLEQAEFVAQWYQAEADERAMPRAEARLVGDWS